MTSAREIISLFLFRLLIPFLSLQPPTNAGCPEKVSFGNRSPPPRLVNFRVTQLSRRANSVGWRKMSTIISHRTICIIKYYGISTRCNQAYLLNREIVSACSAARKGVCSTIRACGEQKFIPEDNVSACPEPSCPQMLPSLKSSRNFMRTPPCIVYLWTSIPRCNLSPPSFSSPSRNITRSVKAEFNGPTAVQGAIIRAIMPLTLP